MKEYRILKYYFTFFGHDGYKLQRRIKFLRWKWWYTVAEDHFGITYYKWQEKFDCPIVDLKEIE